MLDNNSLPQTLGLAHMKIEDFGELQARYQALTISKRAQMVLADATPALEAAARILTALAEMKECKQAFDKLRRNSMLMGKLRPSDARVALMDSSCDFIGETARKLASWRKALERLAQGEAVGKENNKEFIRINEPLAIVIAGTFGVSNYISIVQLALMEISKLDSQNAAKYSAMTAEIRRCATVLSDYENASAFQSIIH